MEDRGDYARRSADEPVIVLLWHNRILAMPAAFERYNRGRRKAVVLTSASSDGSLLALFTSHFGIGAVRGSSSRRASAALRAMVARIHEGFDVFITPDGPRGPRYRLQPGALYLAQRTGCPVMPVHVEYSRYVRLKSWDGFAIPLPFARVQITVGEAVAVDAGLSEQEFENARLRLEHIMTDSLSMDREMVSR